MKRSFSVLFPLRAYPISSGSLRTCSKQPGRPLPNDQPLCCTFLHSPALHHRVPSVLCPALCPPCSSHHTLPCHSVPHPPHCWPHPSHHTHKRCASTVRTPAEETVAADAQEREGLGVRLLKLVGWMGGFYSRKAVLVRASKTLYEDCVDNLNYEEFFEVCSLEDSFQSWFIITHLHVWFFMVRLKREGEDGAYLIRQVVATFWYDVEERMKVLGVYNSMAATRSHRELVQQFYGLTLAYEEGLLSSDKDLASAIWRNMVFDKERDTDPVKLAKMVDYVRKQVQHMDKLDAKSLLETGSIKLLPFSECTKQN